MLSLYRSTNTYPSIAHPPVHSSCHPHDPTISHGMSRQQLLRCGSYPEPLRCYAPLTPRHHRPLTTRPAAAVIYLPAAHLHPGPVAGTAFTPHACNLRHNCSFWHTSTLAPLYYAAV